MKETIALVERYLNVTYDGLPARSIDMAKQCLIDYLGCTLAGLSFESSRMAREFAVENYASGNCTLIGNPQKLVPGGACFANGTTGHAAELDDCTNEGGGHPGVIIMPVVLAMAEDLGLSGKQALLGIVIGYDTFSRIGKASNYQSLFVRGFHPTALLGMFGAAMTASRLINLDLERTANALGIVGSFVAGNLECYADGSFTKRLHAGSSSSAGVTAALLASKGFTGPKSILEGPRGFFHAYCENARPEQVLAETDGFEIDAVSFKPHACCRFNQAAIDGILEIFSENDIHYRAIKSVDVDLPKTPYDVVGQPREVKYNPKNAVDGQFSAPYSVAIACIEKKAFLEEYTLESIQRPDVAELMKKISINHDPGLDKFFPQTFPTRVTLTTEEGRTFVKDIKYPKGDPENPLSWEEVLHKFDRLASTSMLKTDKKDRIVESVRHFEKVGMVKDFMALLC